VSEFAAIDGKELLLMVSPCQCCWLIQVTALRADISVVSCMA